ncbi:DUF975 family protein [Enterococcus sp. AZ103]|uniref:DUF975 family protein n=1 Tax=Enterococcus sp. AZ103 TaxID=2774628 RepID=UPI003F288C19
MKFCPNCGAEVSDVAKFCPNCGFDLEGVESEPAAEENNNEPLIQPTPKQSVSEKMQEEFINGEPEEPVALEIEQSEGLNITRAELKKYAQTKLSGRFGEWFWSIFWSVIIITVITFLMMMPINRMMSGLFNIVEGAIYGGMYNSLGSNYYGNYGNYYSPYYSGASVFFWFIFFIAMWLLLFLAQALIRATFQWCAIYTLRDQKADGVKIFSYLFKHSKNRVLKANVMVAIFTFLWSLLFVIPGLVKTASYAMTNYLLEKHPTLDASDAITLSREIMDGYKLEYWILLASFSVWYIISGFTAFFSLGVNWMSFYVTPYATVTEIAFLDKVYNAYIEKQKALRAENAEVA